MADIRKALEGGIEKVKTIIGAYLSK